MLPHNECDDEHEHRSRSSTRQNTFRDLIQQMESKIDTAFSDINSKLQNIEFRLSSLEERPPPSVPTPSSSSGDSSVESKRKRRTPPELQVYI